ncbi:MAG: hypothetical protein EPN49_05575 [Rhodanobacter sp.]|nr:MAG: hypothetical protein EPN49_05575 [Rhodanobacter sp.]
MRRPGLAQRRHGLRDRLQAGERGASQRLALRREDQRTAVYLSWLGTSLLAGSLRPAAAHATANAIAWPAGLPGLVGFQFLNPKSWVMVLTAVASLPATGLRGYLPLAALFTLIPACCLLLWAGLGTLLSHALARPLIRRCVDAGMGMLLIVCAGLLLIEL